MENPTELLLKSVFRKWLHAETEIKPIREAGRTPVQRNMIYEPVRFLECASAANEVESPTGKSKVLEDNLATV